MNSTRKREIRGFGRIGPKRKKENWNKMLKGTMVKTMKTLVIKTMMEKNKTFKRRPTPKAERNSMRRKETRKKTGLLLLRNHTFCRAEM